MGDNLIGELDAALREAGLSPDAQAVDVARQNAEAQDLSRNGPYTVLGAWSAGDLLVVCEQNTSPDVLGGLNATIQHPPVLVVSSPKGRVAVNPEDLELVRTVVADLS